MSLRNFAKEEDARKLGHHLGAMIHEIGKYIDVSTLEMVVVAFDYDAALAELDRGTETSKPLSASKDWALGVAMTPALIRDGSVKSVILINANVASWLLDENDEQAYGDAIHAVAHECAHVELNAIYDRQFPGRTLQLTYPSWYEALRGETMAACWEEYAATRISAGFGTDPTAGYEEVFVGVLGKAWPNVREAILKYRNDSDLDALVSSAQNNLGNLMKYAAYMLGNHDGFGRSPEEHSAEVIAGLDDHWFRPFFDELHLALREIWTEYGKWETLKPFEKIADIWLRLMADRGLQLSPMEDGGMYVDVPFTPETSPFQATLWKLGEPLRGLAARFESKE